MDKCNKVKAAGAILCLGILLTMSGCGYLNEYNQPPYQHIFLEEEAHITPDVSSPFCDFALDYTYLDEAGDSIARVINRCVQREFLGEEFTTLAPPSAVDSFKNTYIRNYRNEVRQLYLADKAKAAGEEEIPAWYNQTYSLVTFLEEGHAGIVNASANVYVDTGGAHPNQWSRWLNFDFETGHLLTKDEVFAPSAHDGLIQLLLDKLIQQQAQASPEENITSLEDLQQRGILQLTDMYIPDNFLLGKEAIFFLFNRYDIAPYSAGEIVLKVPYGEMEPYLKR